MAEATLPPELVRSVERLSRALLTAARVVMLYPAGHPAVGTAVAGLQKAIHDATGGVDLTLAITPTTFLIGGAVASSGDGPVAEAAALLHHHDLLEVTFAGDVPEATLRAFLKLVGTDPEEIRLGGGPFAVWARSGHIGISIEQVDYQSVLTDRKSRHTPATRDELWLSIVRAVNQRHKTLDEAAQQRLLEIAGDVDAICELAAEVTAPARTLDGSPMITTQAAAVLAAYRHLSGIVSVLAPERREAVLRNLVAATSKLDARLVLQLFTAADEPADGGSGLVAGLIGAFDDASVAQLVATTLALDGQASERLADVFGTLVHDGERKHRVLRLARSLLQETEFGQQTRFDSLWSSMEELLLAHDERRFVSSAYRASLDQAGARAQSMAAGELPPETPAWIRTLGQDNVRRLSVTLLIDLLNLERDPSRAPELAADVATLAEDLLMAGDYEQALRVVTALAAKSADATAVTSQPSRKALDRVAASTALQEAAEDLGEMDGREAERFGDLCRQIGPATAEVLLPALAVEAPTRRRALASAILVSMGAPVVNWLGRLVTSPEWFTQRNAADLLGRIGTPEAVPFLQPLLRSPDPRVVREAVRGLANIEDPSAARAVHAVLRTSTGAIRQAIVGALVAERDPRVVPVLRRILMESKPAGRDHPIVLETLAALGLLGRDEAVPDIAGLMRKKSLLARRRIRAVKQASLAALKRIGTPVAAAAIREAAVTGDRMLRRLARAVTA